MGNETTNDEQTFRSARIDDDMPALLQRREHESRPMERLVSQRYFDLLRVFG